MATIIDESIDDGFIVQRLISRYVQCDGCLERLDIDDNEIEMAVEEGWFQNADGQFCCKECHKKWRVNNGVK